MPVSGFCVETLETLCLSADFVLKLWNRCACQRILCSGPGNVVLVSGFFVEILESLCLSAGSVLRLWKRCAC